jgi:hypothetical protein
VFGSPVNELQIRFLYEEKFLTITGDIILVGGTATDSSN